MADTIAERAVPVRRYSVPTLDWVRMPEAGNEAEPPVFGLDEILDGVAEAGFQAVGLDDLTVGDLDAADVASALRSRRLSCSEVGILRAGQSGETSAAAHDLTWLAQATGAPCCIAIVADPPPPDPLAVATVPLGLLIPCRPTRISSHGSCNRQDAAAAMRSGYRNRLHRVKYADPDSNRTLYATHERVHLGRAFGTKSGMNPR